MPQPRSPGDILVKRPVAQGQFIIKASRERVWELLGRTIYRCLPLEKMNVINETTACAVFRWRLGLISLPLNLKLELVDISPPDSLGSRIRVRKGMFQVAALEVTFKLRSLDKDRTEVVCTGLEQGEGTILSRLLGRKQRAFTEQMFNTIKSRLEQFC